MASKGKRTSAATPQPTSSSTPLGDTRPGSPLSPTRLSRIQEKTELQNLNDRLACYIDRVRNLETENSRLVLEVQSTREHINRESNSIKSMYETELADARRLLDETSREKVKLEIDTKKLFEENEELKAKLDKKTKDCNLAEGNARMNESRLSDLQGKYTVTLADRKKIADELGDLQKEFDRLRKQFSAARENLEAETLARIDLENNIQSLREDIAFKEQVHLQKVNESYSRRQTDISEIDGRLSEQYEAKLQKSLQELRERYEAQMRANREEIEGLYETKTRNLQDAASRSSNHVSAITDELRSTRTRIEGLKSRIGELESANSTLSARIHDLEALLDNERARHNDQIAQLQDELQRLRDEQQQQMKDYQDLMETKISLDLEIAAYDKLLCGEESRLNITPTSGMSFSQTSRSSRATPTRKTPSRSGPLGGAKRKRTIIEESEDLSQSEYFFTANTKGDVEISKVDTEGKFVELRNKGPKEVQIGGWQLIRNAGGKETTFKFHRTVKIDSGATVTVWSSDTGASHEPPANIVMKTQKWVVGENIKTMLFNSDGEEVAGSENVKRTRISQTSRSRVRGAGLSTVDGEDLYHQQGDPREGQEKCRLM